MKVKKTPFSTALFLLLPFLLFAQLSDSTKIKPTAVKLPVLSAGFHVGINASNTTTSTFTLAPNELNLSQVNTELNINARIGIQFLFHIGANYGIETGIVYEKMGLQFSGYFDAISNQYIPEDNTTSELAFEYFTIPFLFKKKFNLPGKINLSAHAGPYLGLLQSAAYSSETINIAPNQNGTLVESIIENSVPLKETYTRKRDIGLRFQFGAERVVSDIATLYLTTFYSRGLTDIATNFIDDRGVHNAYGISIGGYFKMR